MVKFIDITYAKVDLEHVVANETPMNSDASTQLLGLLMEFEELFYGPLV